MTVTTSEQLFEVRRRFRIGGELVEGGQIIDLKKYDLPPGRAAQLVRARFGEMVSQPAPDKPAPVRKPAPFEDIEPAPAPRTAVELQADRDREMVAPLLKNARGDEALSEYRGPAVSNDFVGMTKPALIATCKERGLPVYGTKRDLIDRLRGQTEV